MGFADRIRAAIAHLEDVAMKVNAGIEHDAGIVVENVHALLHYGEDQARLKVAEMAKKVEDAAEPPAGG